MSFANFDVESQTVAKQPVSQQSALLDKLSDSVSDFANNLNKFEKNLSSIGSNRDNSKLRSILSTFEANLSNLSQLISTELNNDTNLHDLNDKESFIYNKISNEFKKLNSKFVTVKNEYHEKIQNFQINEQLEQQLISEEEEQQRYNESSPLLDQQQQQQQLQQQQVPQINERELQYHQYLIQQRSQDITQLSSGVEEINVIFKDLNSLIQQQGQQVDRIEDNLITYTNNNQFANQELIKADNYQRKKGRCCFFLLIGLILMVVIVALVIT